MALTKEEIKEYKSEEKEAEDCTDFSIIADQLSDAGDKEWAKNLYKKAEEKADGFYDFRNLALKNVVGRERFERSTIGLKVRCSTS